MLTLFLMWSCCSNWVGGTSFNNGNHGATSLIYAIYIIQWPASCIRGVPVKFSTPPWTKSQINQALHRGAHKSCHEYVDFLHKEFSDMIEKGQWVVLPVSVAKGLPGL